MKTGNTSSKITGKNLLIIKIKLQLLINEYKYTIFYVTEERYMFSSAKIFTGIVLGLCFATSSFKWLQYTFLLTSDMLCLGSPFTF